MLSYATSHPEIKWLYKPHPTLRICLEASGVWSRAKIAAYYAAWEALGCACYDGSYPSYFKSSRVMITDCGSFLPEYGCTGKPIIHLISSTRKIYREDGGVDAFESYYQAHDCVELEKLLQMVVVENRDPKKASRLEALSEAGLLGNNAAQNVMDYLSTILGVHDEPAAL